MDYEFQIKLLEQETAHLREMLKLGRQRQDTTDDRLEQITEILLQTAKRLDSAAGHLDVVSVNLDVLSVRVGQLADLMVKRSPNGQADPPAA